MKYLNYLSRLLVGGVFIFSGFVKAVDPLGSAYKFGDYFSAFQLDFLSFLAFPLSVGMAALELALGLVLILGYRKQTMYWVLLVFMAFFTVLTLILALFNPVSDCGCFGDALILTNWQTFGKNVVLMVFVLILFLGRHKHQDESSMKEWMLIGMLYLGAVVFSIWNDRHLPLLDFRPYDVGTVISEKMEIPEGAPVDEYETTLVYRNREEGKEVEFGMDNYPRDTALWEFVNSESRLVKKGYEPPIHDFAIMDAKGVDLADQILNDPGYSLLMVSHHLPGADEAALVQAGEWAQLELLCDDYRFYAVTATTQAEAEEIQNSLGLELEFLAADEIMLKTMVRSNPGYLLIHKGVIIGKWGYRDFPELGSLDPGIMEGLESAAMPMDEESQMLMEAGVLEGFSFGVMDFSELLPALVYRQAAGAKEKGVIWGVILAILLVLITSHHVKRIE